jgi:hypothetical protein
MIDQLRRLRAELDGAIGLLERLVGAGLIEASESAPEPLAWPSDARNDV